MCILNFKYIFMAPLPQTDEDLIIIWDDTQNDTSMLDFNFDITLPSQKEEEVALIDFGSDETKVDTSFSLDTESLPTPEVNFDFGSISFDTPVSENIETQAIIETPEVQDLDFSFIEDETPTQVVSETPTVSDLVEETAFFVETSPKQAEISSLSEVNTLEETLWFDRNSILDEAIAKMQSRKSSIWASKSQKQDHIDALSEQVKALKEQISDLNSEVKELDIEDSALDLDIASITKMKSSILEPSQRQRKPNLWNIKK